LSLPLLSKRFPLAGLGVGIIGCLAVTLTFSQLLVVNASTAGFFYLLVVLAVATTAGFRVSALVSLLATLCFNFFFLPPFGRLTIADPENWVALFTFLLTALVASHLSDRAHREAAEAKRRQRETEQLYALSRSILLTGSSRPIGLQAAQSIAQIFDSSAVLIYDGVANKYFQGGARDVEGLETRMADVVRLGSHVRDEARDIDIWPIALGGNPVGALAGAGIRISDGAVQSMLNLVAIALERVRTEEAANRAEVARQSEEFKSTLLDAIAHEFKTPLTSIKAAATGLRAFEERMTADQLDLAAIIEEETDRLSFLVTEAVKIAEIDAGKVKPQRRAISAHDVLEAAIASFHLRGGERIMVHAQSAAPHIVDVDPDLMTLAIRQVLDNALKYSTAEVRCEIGRDAQSVLLRIHDRGEGIPERDRERVFEKFYRRAGSRDKTPGSGLGLYIAREIARIHGGDLWIEPSDEAGTLFCFGVPAGGEQA